ncbi:MAG: NifU family protein [Alphaproteobacteria bacterium]|nr:NifU family protein [Alphaproteobacteria bacterium]
MFIQTEETPNPASLKFLPGCEVMVSGNAEFTDKEKAGEASPLAARLFELNGVTGVFLGADFVTVSKNEYTDWADLKTLVLAALMEHFTRGEPVMNDEHLEQAAANASSAQDGDSEIVLQIKELLDTRVRPMVAQDGGDIVFEGFENGVVFLHMRGACAGCPSSTATLKLGIENLLKHFVPEVSEVRAVN